MNCIKIFKNSLSHLALDLTNPLSRRIVIGCVRARSSSTMSQSNVLYSADYLKEKLKKTLDAEHVEVEDLSGCCGMKFDAVIVSQQFEGKPILQRQRVVNQILAEEMKAIHAFSMKTLTPGQWKS